jgi:methylated-DNA-[protein]-cysteine S-methyltransferase
MSWVYDSPAGKLYITGNDTAITGVAFYDGNGAGEPCDNDIIRKCVYELDEYFAGRLKDFTVPLSLGGTDFQKRVWRALREIPYGQTISYKDLAVSVGNPKASRAVGGANHHNPIVIIIPCHRVIGSDGKLTGFGGGLGVKEFLLEHERKCGGNHFTVI